MHDAVVLISVSAYLVFVCVVASLVMELLRRRSIRRAAERSAGNIPKAGSVPMSLTQKMTNSPGGVQVGGYIPPGCDLDHCNLENTGVIRDGELQLIERPPPPPSDRPDPGTGKRRWLHSKDVFDLTEEPEGEWQPTPGKDYYQCWKMDAEAIAELKSERARLKADFEYKKENFWRRMRWPKMR